jgi:amidase
MARTVADAALLLGVLAGMDPRDPATKDADRRGQRDYSHSLDRDGLRGARIGVVRNRLFGASPAADRLAEIAIADMQRQGATIVDPANIPTLGKFDDSEFDVLLYEFKADLNAYLAARTAGSSSLAVHSLKDIMDFNNRHRDQELPFFGQEIMEMADKKGPLTEDKYRAELAQNLRLARTKGIDAVMTKYKLDALVAPTGGPAWLIDLVNGDGGTAAAPGPSTVAAVAGYPHITVPMGFVADLPVGLSFVGRAWSEPTLIRLAYAYEQATRHRHPPRLAPSAAHPAEVNKPQ